MTTNTKSKVIALVICVAGVIGLAVCAIGFGTAAHRRRRKEEEEYF